MSTRAQEHKSKYAQITCAAAVYALAPIQSVLGATAIDRFNAVHNFNKYSSPNSNWLVIALTAFITLSIAALVVTTLYNKLQERFFRKTQDNENNTQYRSRYYGSSGEFRPQKTQGQKSQTNASPSDIEQRVSNIEKRLSAIEQQLTNLETEVSYFGVTGDLNTETQVLATVESDRPTGEDKK